MPGRDEILRSLTGAWRLFLDRPDALRHFDLSVDGFWRSFGAIVLILPAYMAIAAAERTRILTDAVADGGFDTTAFALNRALTLALDWVTLPVVLAFIAASLGVQRNYVAFVVARNWGAVLATLPFGAIGMLFLGGLLGGDAANLISLAFLIVVVRFNYLIARRALGADIGLAIGLIVADFAISLAIVGFVDAILGYRPVTS